MLEIRLPESEDFNEFTNEFIQVPGQILRLEHSLKSISKWESKWKKPFLETKDLTADEILDYIKCMTITKNVKDETYLRLGYEHVEAIKKYIEDPMTATTFGEDRKKTGKQEFITSELIYYWMVAQQIPFECENWNLNRLLVLIRICSIKNSPDKKMSKRDLAKRNSALNAKRKAQYNTKG